MICEAQKFHPSLNENRKYFSFCWLLRGSAPPLVLLLRQPMIALGCCKAVNVLVFVCFLVIWYHFHPNQGIFISFFSSLCARRSISRIWLHFHDTFHYVTLSAIIRLLLPTCFWKRRASHTITAAQGKLRSTRDKKGGKDSETRRKKINSRKKHAEIGKQDLLTRMNGGGRLRIKFHVFFRLLGVASRFSQKAAGKKLFRSFFLRYRIQLDFCRRVAKVLHYFRLSCASYSSTSRDIIQFKASLLWFFSLEKRVGEVQKKGF